MKQSSTIPVCCLAFLLSCGSSYDEPRADENMIVSLTAFNFSGCKNYLSANKYQQARTNSQRECIEYKCIGDGILQFSHTNVLYCCEQKNLSAYIEQKGSNIIITESEGEINTNCVCLYDLSYSISGLEQGHKYSITIKRGNEEKIKFIIKYSLSGKGKIFVEWW